MKTLSKNEIELISGGFIQEVIVCSIIAAGVGFGVKVIVDICEEHRVKEEFVALMKRYGDF